MLIRNPDVKLTEENFDNITAAVKAAKLIEDMEQRKSYLLGITVIDENQNSLNLFTEAPDTVQ